MYSIKGRIKGVADILFNRMIESPEAGSKGKMDQKQKEAEALERVYRDEKGIYVPAWNFKKCLMTGANKGGIKYGRSGLYSFIEATVFPKDLYFGKQQPDYIHVWPGRIPPRTGPAVILRRPAMKMGWELPFEMGVTDDRIKPELLKKSAYEAGMLSGLGSWRPQYGRFIVTEWEVIES